VGQKINPHGLRLGIIRDWEGKWYADRNYEELLMEDLKIRRYVKDKLYHAGIDSVKIERAASRVKISIHTARPGMVIGRGGTEVDKLRAELEKMTGKSIQVNIQEVKNGELSAQLVAENIASQILRRTSFRRAIKQSMSRTLKFREAEGMKVRVSGRLNGAEIARSEVYSEGKVPLHTFRADIDYGYCPANTTYGAVGVKVWINKGEILPERTRSAAR